MVYCGRCGLQLAQGSTRCPRCGALIEVDVISEDPHMNDPTVISPRRDDPRTLPVQPGQYYPPGATPVPPSQITLRPGEHPSQPGIVNPNDPITYPSGAYTPLPSSDPISYPGYNPPSMPGYPSSPAPGQYGDWNTPSPEQPKRRRTGLIVLITVILVLLIAGGAAVAIINPSPLQGLFGGQATPTPAPIQNTPGATATSNATATATATATSTPTPVQQARAVIEHYYNDINARDYQDAYNLWSIAYQQSQSYSAFAAGYANTIHDNITIVSLTEQPGGTVLANVIISANEQTTSGPVVSTYQGTYVIGVEGGIWKFLSGHFTKTG